MTTLPSFDRLPDEVMRVREKIVNVTNAAISAYGDNAIALHLGLAVNKMLVDGSQYVIVREMARTGDNRRFILAPVHGKSGSVMTTSTAPRGLTRSREFRDKAMTEDERNTIIDECAQAARMADRLDREWVRGSLWDNITRLASEQVLKLKRPAHESTATQRG